jgi:SAM-dependent methyltransferase
VSETERDKWNERYRAGSYEDRVHPTALLADWMARLPRGSALDVACGAGRNALFLAAAGHEVHAIDIADAGLTRARASARERDLEVRWIAADLDDDPDDAIPRRSYDLIVWIRYVNPKLMPHLLDRLGVGGHLICEQHLCTTADVVGPRGDRFRLQPNELRASATGLHVLHYYEGLVDDPDGRTASLAQLVGRKSA